MNLYNNLMALCKDDDSGFYYKDFFADDDKCQYRIFSYRMVSYTQFQTLPDAKECRGIMFRIIEDTPELVCRPMEKFFNAHEGQVTHDWNNPKLIMTKEDGSLISTFMDKNNNLQLKSKTSLNSEHVQESNKILENNSELKNLLSEITSKGITVNMEYVSPLHRIVLPYNTPQLIILNCREIESGKYVDLDYLDIPKQYKVKNVKVEDIQHFVDSIPSMTGIEGFVIQKNNGEFVKLKTLEYLTLHKSKESINNPRALFECVLEELTDDMRELFANDPTVLDLITRMENTVYPIYNELVSVSENYYNTNKHLDRKEYMVKAEKLFRKNKEFFILVAGLYSGKIVNVKDLMISRWPMYKDEIIKEVYHGVIPNEE